MSIKRQKSSFRLFTMANVEDWLGKKLGGKVIRLATVNDGIVYIDNANEQLRILFPKVAIDVKDPSIILGLVLDKEKGWFLCTFKYKKNAIKNGVLKSIIRELGYAEKYPITSLLYNTLRNNTNVDSIKDVKYSIDLLLKWTFKIPTRLS